MHNYCKSGYITQQGAANLATYAYSGVDKSLIANYILKHFWNWLVEKVPIWMAPNVLTLSGLLCIGGSFIIVLYNCSDIYGCELPSWAYLVISLLIFAYQTLDNLDGKQARRTGSSSALGEVFDHGGDSLTVPMFAIIIGSALQFGPMATYILLVYLSFVFFACHWEGYFTGTVILDMIANPTEAQLAVMTLLLLTMNMGTSIWLQEIDTIFFGLVQLNHLILIGGIIGGLIGLYQQVPKIRNAALSKGYPLRSIFLFLTPFILVYSMSALWIKMSPTILYQNPRLFLFTFGWYSSYMSIRQIVHSVCKEPFKLYYNVHSAGILCLLLAVVGVFFTPIIDEVLILKMLCLIVVLNIGVLGTSLINEFCYYLDIWAFSIKPKVPIADTV